MLIPGNVIDFDMAHFVDLQRGGVDHLEMKASFADGSSFRVDSGKCGFLNEMYNAAVNREEFTVPQPEPTVRELAVKFAEEYIDERVGFPNTTTNLLVDGFLAGIKSNGKTVS